MEERFEEVFQVELECWCYGLQRIKGKIDVGVVHKVVKEFAPVLREAIQHSYICNLSETAHRFAEAAKLSNAEKEIAFNLLSQLPSPDELTETQASVLTEVVKVVEKDYGGAFQRLEKKWHSAKPSVTKGRAESDHAKDAKFLSGLAFPAKAASAGH